MFITNLYWGVLETKGYTLFSFPGKLWLPLKRFQLSLRWQKIKDHHPNSTAAAPNWGQRGLIDTWQLWLSSMFWDFYSLFLSVCDLCVSLCVCVYLCVCICVCVYVCVCVRASARWVGLCALAGKAPARTMFTNPGCDQSHLRSLLLPLYVYTTFRYFW